MVKEIAVFGWSVWGGERSLVVKYSRVSTRGKRERWKSSGTAVLFRTALKWR